MNVKCIQMSNTIPILCLIESAMRCSTHVSLTEQLYTVGISIYLPQLHNSISCRIQIDNRARPTITRDPADGANSS